MFRGSVRGADKKIKSAAQNTSRTGPYTTMLYLEISHSQGYALPCVIPNILLDIVLKSRKLPNSCEGHKFNFKGISMKDKI